ncbi:MAG TPA: hypothetical protein VNR41_05255, partial [Xanthobacteraceae bacterium]|nr:hypothetical protein [Xanthobacteraceae bacterium]
MKVFWSWQSDTLGKIGRHFVRDAISAAISAIKGNVDILEPESRGSLHIDHDRQGVAGSPELAQTILKKIEQSAVFIADVTPVGFISTDLNEGSKKLINSNVGIELGYALHALSDASILMVMNEFYGRHEDLPFDLRSKAGPITFKLSPDASRAE